MFDFPDAYFQRYDESPDERFYITPRKVVHIDEMAILLYYATILPQNAIILDLMSSWRSHLPHDLAPQKVLGIGMNAEEMADNPQLDEYIVQNLNEQPALNIPDNTFDTVLCAVSVQYLTAPIAIFREVNRILKPNGRFIVSFSNRCFPSKAVAVWLELNDMQHVALVVSYYEKAGNWLDIQTEIKTSGTHDPMFIVSAQKAV